MNEPRMTPPMLRPDYKEFSRLAENATLVPVVKSVAADLLTPVSAFLAIAANEPHAFLLESVERGEQIGRYTFLGVRPNMQVRARGSDIEVLRGKKKEERQGSAIQVIKELLRQHRPAIVPGLPPFTAGAVGYFAYDVVRQLENIGDHTRDDFSLPDCVLMFFDRLLAFDHLRHQIHIIAAADVSRESPRRAYDRAAADIAVLEKKLAKGLRPAHWHKSPRPAKGKLIVHAGTPRQRFIHRCRGHLPGRAFAAAGFYSVGCALRCVSRFAHGQSFSLLIFSTHGRDACSGLVAGDAGAGDGKQAGISSDCGNASARP
jgi:anthranilate synthase component 1